MWNRWIEGNISCWIVLCSLHYIRCFYHQNMVLLAVSPTLCHCTGLFSCFSQYARGREREEDNFIWTKCEPLRNTQWLCHQFSMPFPPISPIVAIFGYILPRWRSFPTATNLFEFSYSNIRGKIWRRSFTYYEYYSANYHQEI